VEVSVTLPVPLVTLQLTVALAVSPPSVRATAVRTMLWVE
jgi:hypothetical protein